MIRRKIEQTVEKHIKNFQNYFSKRDKQCVTSETVSMIK